MGAIKQFRKQKEEFTRHDSLKVAERMEVAHRSISYVNIPSFSLAIETLLDPSLRDRPVALASPFLRSERIQECSERARNEGVTKGMLLSQAKVFCRDLTVITPRVDLYGRIAGQLEKDIQQIVPVFERDVLGKGFIDYTGLDSVYGNPKDFHGKLREKIKDRYSLSADVGISCNKLVSKIAAKSLRGQSEHLSLVEQKNVQSYLAPLPIEYLPIIAEINQRHVARRWEVLDDLNLKLIQDLQILGREHLQVAFGKMGELLHNFALGVDPRPVTPVKTKPTIFLDHEFEEESNNCRLIFHVIDDLVDRCIYQLSQRSSSADSCEISLRYTTSHFKKYTIKKKEGINQKEQLRNDLIKVMEKIGERRTAIKWLQVEMLGVEKVGQQLLLFEGNNQKKQASIQAIETKFPGRLLTFKEKLKLVK